MPPKKWINRKRLEKAQQMININNYSITEICFLTGFGNLSYFIRSFKKEFGETPKKTQLKQKPAFTKKE
jgi:AraC-like DNA-binding protein